jgi:ubiquinone/menaquinone biosynthesis C-methylase UbiE
MVDDTVSAFNEDVERNKGYLYTTHARLSSRLANERLTEAALRAVSFRDKSVLDVGCGDGASTVELMDQAHPASIVGIDFASEAVKLAQGRTGGRAITYQVCSAESLPFPDGSFDVALLRGVLHHLNDARQALKEAMRVARQVLVIEPNGYNPVLKAIEKLSPYHRKHQEKSFAPLTLARWVRELGGTLSGGSYAGLVPFFCPDPAARALKAMEPLVEKIPVVRELSCAVYVFVVNR